MLPRKRRVEAWHPNRLDLETNVEQKQDMLSMTVREFIAAVAAKSPTPGGGSVAGVVGALGVALGEMALNFTRGKKKFAQHEEYHAHLSSRLEHARAMAIDLVSDDVAAYSLYRDAAAMADGADKDQAMQLALSAAINVPREMAKLCLAVMQDLSELLPKCNPYLVSDLTAAAALATATVTLCDYNVRINIPQFKDRAASGEIAAQSAADLEKAKSLQASIEQQAKPLFG